MFPVSRYLFPSSGLGNFQESFHQMHLLPSFISSLGLWNFSPSQWSSSLGHYKPHPSVELCYRISGAGAGASMDCWECLGCSSHRQRLVSLLMHCLSKHQEWLPLPFSDAVSRLNYVWPSQLSSFFTSSSPCPRVNPCHEASGPEQVFISG